MPARVYITRETIHKCLCGHFKFECDYYRLTHTHTVFIIIRSRAVALNAVLSANNGNRHIYTIAKCLRFMADF